MTKQTESASLPLRPAMMYVKAQNDPHNVVLDAPPVSWAAGATSINLKLDVEAMNSPGRISLNASFRLVLGVGQWEITMHPIVHELGAGGTVRCAITDSAGTLIHRESDDVDVPAAESIPLRLTAVVHVRTPATIVELRIASTTATMDILEDMHVASIRRIGNKDET